MVETFAGLSVAILILVAGVVVVRTLALWRRTRGLPELFLGLYLTFATVAGYPLAIAMGQIHPADNWQIHVLAESVMSCGWVCLLLFTLSVFRRDALWARCLVGTTICLIGADVVAYVIEVTGPNPRSPEELPGFGVMLSLPVAIAYFWTTFEALSYHRQLKRRLRLGLAERPVVNRVLMWGLMTLAAGVALVINMVAMLGGTYLSPPIVLVSSLLGLAHASCLLLAFHPPAWYTRWLEQSTPVEAA